MQGKYDIKARATAEISELLQEKQIQQQQTLRLEVIYFGYVHYFYILRIISLRFSTFLLLNISKSLELLLLANSLFTKDTVEINKS